MSDSSENPDDTNNGGRAKYFRNYRRRRGRPQNVNVPDQSSSSSSLSNSSEEEQNLQNIEGILFCYVLP